MKYSNSDSYWFTQITRPWPVGRFSHDLRGVIITYRGGGGDFGEKNPGPLFFFPPPPPSLDVPGPWISLTLVLSGYGSTVKVVMAQVMSVWAPIVRWLMCPLIITDWRRQKLLSPTMCDYLTRFRLR